MHETSSEIDVSIIIAAHNAGHFVRRAVDSALTQSGVRLEVVIVDDCSTDDTLQVIRRIAETDDRIRTLSLNINRGPSVARNAAIASASGKWLAVLDADDAFLPERLNLMVAIAENNHADIVLDNFQFYFGEHSRREAYALLERPDVRTLSTVEYVYSCRPGQREADYGLLKPLFRASFLHDHQLRYPEDTRHGEDFAMIFAALLRGARLVVSQKAGYLYTVRSSGLSQTNLDYSSQANSALALAGSHLPEQDEGLRKALISRADDLQRLSDRVKAQRAIKSQQIGLALRLIAKRPELIADLTAVWWDGFRNKLATA